MCGDATRRPGTVEDTSMMLCRSLKLETGRKKINRNQIKLFFLLNFLQHFPPRSVTYPTVSSTVISNRTTRHRALWNCFIHVDQMVGFFLTFIALEVA